MSRIKMGEKGKIRLSGVGYFGRFDVVLRKVDAMVVRYGMHPPGREFPVGLQPLNGAGTIPAGGVRREGGNPEGFSGFLLACERDEWTLSLFIRRQGRLQRIRSVRLGDPRVRRDREPAGSVPAPAD